MLFELLCGHALADFALQSDRMAQLKNRHNKPDSIPAGQKYTPCWFYWLAAHALIHAGVVFVITKSYIFSGLELVGHFVIDFLKCEGVTNPHEDQIFHFGMKLVYWLSKMGM